MPKAKKPSKTQSEDKLIKQRQKRYQTLVKEYGAKQVDEVNQKLHRLKLKNLRKKMADKREKLLVERDFLQLKIDLKRRQKSEWNAKLKAENEKKYGK